MDILRGRAGGVAPFLVLLFKGFVCVPLPCDFYQGNYWGYLNVDGQPQGYGTLVMSNGDTYTGDWKEGERHGKGTHVWKESGDTYHGDWMEGQPHGSGTLVMSNGDKYTGDWKAGQPHGSGMQAMPNGDTYTGNWKEGKLLHHHGVATIGGVTQGAYVPARKRLPSLLILQGITFPPF